MNFNSTNTVGENISLKPMNRRQASLQKKEKKTKKTPRTNRARLPGAAFLSQSTTGHVGKQRRKEFNNKSGSHVVK